MPSQVVWSQIQNIFCWCFWLVLYTKERGLAYPTSSHSGSGLP